MAAVLVRGDGVAASSCSRLLDGASIQVGMEAQHRPKLPAIMLGETTQKLLRDVFDGKDLFTGLPRISRRVVLWGAGAAPVTVPHSAVVVSEQELLDRIQSGSGMHETVTSGVPDWTIFASSPLPPVSVQFHFGSRPATASAVILESEAEAGSCWIESLENGWLFLLPTGNRNAWLLSVGDSVESLLSASLLIHERIRHLVPSPGTFHSHPRAAFPLSAPGWLSCGTAALGFDPLCGDGAGNAVREAILGSAVFRAAFETGDVHGLVSHYQTRLLGGFRRHLALCFEFYKSGHSGPWWDRQLDDLQQGLSWCSDELKRSPGYHYRLNGFRLERAE